MLKSDEKSNANAWELEVTCKNKQYLDEVVNAILKYGMINFEVQSIDCICNDERWDGRYIVFMWCSWFSNLKKIVSDLAEIEESRAIN
jgi:hypothetical protein